MSSNYYYLYSSLPEIFFDEKYDYRELAHLYDDVMESMSDSDKAAMRYVRYPIDNANLVTLLDEKPNAESRFLPGGNFSLNELKNEIKLKDTIPLYMQRFFESFNLSQAPFGIRNHIDLLNENFYTEIMNLPDVRRGGSPVHEGVQDTLYDFEQNREIFDSYFIKRWYVFERDFRNVLTAIECQKHNEPIERREFVRLDQKTGQQLLGDYDVTQSLRQSKSYDYSLSGTFSWMGKVLNLNSENINHYEKELVSIQLELLDDLAGDDNFSLNAILAFFIKLRILIRWSSLDETGGGKYIDSLSQKVMNFAYENHR